ncbi:hypothetical protein [Enterobacter hormaechei]|uniref:hypothetical protein n=1 Tax=Enterobacter hormaechei TaxID=158836 RepID=UPI0023E38CBD|nr:hypothetical protein [Enterobacter hormaechei]MDF3675355.1 hypothetical protein [Enterobacter hormaechei]
MFLFSEYDTFWIYLSISSLIPILAFSISRSLAPINKGPEKATSYESGIEPMGDTWIDLLKEAIQENLQLFIMLEIV